MHFIGSIARLQIQRASLKVGQKPDRWYDPGPLHEVPALLVTPGGVRAEIDAQTVIDVHHRDHPHSKFAGDNGVSVGFTAHYRAMRSHFGDHLSDGVAGENILVESEETIEEEQLARGLALVTATDLVVQLSMVRVAEPCVEFSRYALGRECGAGVDVSNALRFLRGGMRGFYATYTGEDPMVVRPGDGVYHL